MDFYPRSPCGERPYSQHVTRPSGYFYPRSPCGERPKAAAASACFATFLSTLSLRRATQTQGLKIPALCISIHALLAESDAKTFEHYYNQYDFYPRSPCGERRNSPVVVPRTGHFYPRSPCGERPLASGINPNQSDFYPRSPCGERLALDQYLNEQEVFLSTLSLRRATCFQPFCQSG